MSENFKDIAALYREITTGYDEPDAIWGNGEMVLHMRSKIGIKDKNDSNGDPILGDRLYCVSKGGKTLPVSELP